MLVQVLTCFEINYRAFLLFLTYSITATKATIKLTEEMARSGADAVMVVTPSYFKASMNVKIITKSVHARFFEEEKCFE